VSAIPNAAKSTETRRTRRFVLPSFAVMARATTSATRHAAVLERFRHEHGAADARRGQGLIQEQLAERELTEPSEGKREPRGSGRFAENLRLREIGGGLKQQCQKEPPEIRLLHEARELTLFGETQCRRDDGDEKRDPEKPRDPSTGAIWR
jgi:hypothetical protein